MWEFAEIRDLAITNLERKCLTEVEKIEIAHKFDIQKWCVPAYKELAKRTGALTVEEATKIGFEFAIKLGGVRERRIARTSGSPGDWKADQGNTDAESALEADIRTTFNL